MKPTQILNRILTFIDAKNLTFKKEYYHEFKDKAKHISSIYNFALLCQAELNLTGLALIRYDHGMLILQHHSLTTDLTDDFEQSSGSHIYFRIV